MADKQEKQSGNPAGVPGADRTADSKLSEKERGRLIDKELRKVAADNPEQLARIIKTWLAEGK